MHVCMYVCMYVCTSTVVHRVKVFRGCVGELRKILSTGKPTYDITAVGKNYFMLLLLCFSFLFLRDANFVVLL